MGRRGKSSKWWLDKIYGQIFPAGFLATVGPRRTLGYRARARTSVTSSGCSLSPIQSATAVVTISVMRSSGK